MPRTQRKTKNNVHLERLQTISEIVRQQISFAQIPWTLGELRKALFEECLSLCIAAGMLERRVSPIAVTKLVRQRLRKERTEFRWWAQDDNGKRVRRGKSVLVIKHPVQIQDDESPEDSWSEPLEEVCSDSEGKFRGSSSDIRNNVEARMIERLDAIAMLGEIQGIVGREALNWMTSYVEGKHNGLPLSKSARNRFAYLKKKVIQSFGPERRLSIVGEDSPDNGEQTMKHAKTKTTRTMTLRTRPRNLREVEQYLALAERQLASGRLKPLELSGKEKLELDEFLVNAFWGIGQEESAPVVVRLQALEHLALIVGATKSKLLEQVAA